MTTAIELLANLVIGEVESVSPDNIQVLLELNAPHSTALNTGVPSAFPRLNGYVLIPNESGATVGYISWIGIERSPYPKRHGMKDFGLIDLPFPLRKMKVSPVGTLTCSRHCDTGFAEYALIRGVVAFPSVGDQVLIPTAEQVEAIVGGKDNDKRVAIGTSPLSSNATISLDPDKVFGRHLAVLGNTGSGKSCTVAGLIRWSIEAAESEANRNGRKTAVNARFIILDPNGEYARAYRDMGEGKVRVFRVPPVKDKDAPFELPAWMWNGREWTAVAQAQPGAQRPLLFRGLRELKSEKLESVPREAVIRSFLNSHSVRITAMLNSGLGAFSGSTVKRFDCARLLGAVALDCHGIATDVDDALVTELQSAAAKIIALIDARRSKQNSQFFEDFVFSDLENARTLVDTIAIKLPEALHDVDVSEDTPRPFDVKQLAFHLERIAIEQGGNLAAFTTTLGLRIRGMLADKRLAEVISHEPTITFERWLNDYVGSDDADNGPLAVIDLSLVPSEIIHILIAVFGRLVFEACQRYRRNHADGRTLPTVLVLEEAHTFVSRGRVDDGAAMTAAQLCRETYERIAREGRKFGLGMVLSSQRPSELSPTVLAQCNTFILHRIVNDEDRKLVASLVPDNVSGLLSELPSLPPRQAIVLGWATPIPVLVELNELDEQNRPHSADPDFWDVWTRRVDRPISWQTIVEEWAK